jgi:hypothetical protein
MLSTRLQLELLLQDSFVDLSAVSQVILSDAGATLQIFRLIGGEYPNPEDRPTRMEDCIASLSLDRWYSAVCACSLPLNHVILGEWERFRRIAQCARQLAHCVEGFSPEEAYLVGLLSEMGKLPRLLGWKLAGECSGEQHALAFMLAEYWQLPAYLKSAIREQQEASTSSQWSEMLQVAQCLAARTAA